MLNLNFLARRKTFTSIVNVVQLKCAQYFYLMMHCKQQIFKSLCEDFESFMMLYFLIIGVYIQH